MISRWSQTWLPVVMQSTPASCSSAQILAVMPKPAAAFSPLTDHEIEAELAAQPRHFLGHRIAAGAADDIAAEQNLHALDKGASAPVGQQPIEPLVVRPMRNFGHELGVEADADRRHRAPARAGRASVRS